MGLSLWSLSRSFIAQYKLYSTPLPFFICCSVYDLNFVEVCLNKQAVCIRIWRTITTFWDLVSSDAEYKEQKYL
ncbi:hypothetical protein PILCRDRAFT_812361 [Piloderma croceum F 1598]|uniref:Uncharacterized protein n=1 Tax=Piloderma croceum (strain F 1598) TaxID=765440 RepID=A0A0C3GIY8_PILCF|nr:hypothetical protein PILCRDRAFT_812361 [Piloderma croceum F 1598]